MQYTGKTLCVVRGNNQIVSAPIFEGIPIYTPAPTQMYGWEYLSVGIQYPLNPPTGGYIPFNNIGGADFDSIPLSVRFSQYTKTCTWPKCIATINYTWTSVSHGPYGGGPFEYFIVPGSIAIPYGIRRSLEIVVLWHQLNIGWQAQSIGVISPLATSVSFSGQYGGGYNGTDTTSWYFVIRDNDSKTDIARTSEMSYNSSTSSELEIARNWWA